MISKPFGEGKGSAAKNVVSLQVILVFSSLRLRLFGSQIQVLQSQVLLIICSLYLFLLSRVFLCLILSHSDSGACAHLRCHGRMGVLWKLSTEWVLGRIFIPFTTSLSLLHITSVFAWLVPGVGDACCKHSSGSAGREGLYWFLSFCCLWIATADSFGIDGPAGVLEQGHDSF